MKSKISAALLILILLTELTVSVRLTAQEQTDPDTKHHRYRLVDLGTFGGVTSYINPVGNGGPYMNRQGAVVGSSMTSIPIPPDQNGFPCPSPPNEVFHALEWGDGVVTDLESLGDPSNCSNALSINDHGVSVGTSENGKIDPDTGVLQIRAVQWKQSCRSSDQSGHCDRNGCLHVARASACERVGLTDRLIFFRRGFVRDGNGRTPFQQQEHGR